MLERALFSLLLAIVGFVIYAGFKRWHMQRAGRRRVAGHQPTLLYFRSDACAPCATQGHYLGQLEERFRQAVAFRQIEADRERDVAAQFGVFTLPTILILDTSGVVRHANYGLTDPQRLTHQLEKIL